MVIFQKIDKTSANQVWSKMKMLQVVQLQKPFHFVGFGTRKPKKSVLLLLGFLLMHDTWNTSGLDRVNETVDLVKETFP